MLEPVFTALEKLVTEFSWKRFLYVSLIAMLAVVFFSSFEWYTAYFRLARLEKSVAILETLQELETNGIANNPKLSRVYGALSTELQETVYPRRLGSPDIQSRRVPRNAPLLKFLAGGALWWLIALFVPLSLADSPRSEKWTGFFGLLAFGAVFGGVGLLIPNIFWPWINLVVYPVGHILGLLFLVTLFAFRSVAQRRSSVEI